ncbi:hypothetical protein KPA07_06340 [Corynebacterium aurimucosum]|uniref:hypothetical protein n=1 Tax=Corynebacterium aurimucosum TaxID=169292 RepID=UPI001C0F3370|nr:hypothetical protein [Corynebacterium aurimucosum]MBU5654531.1 hypothetical protein [Corynebacterium aurimucosum]
MVARYGRETLVYYGPVTGRKWQLQGQGQENHPVTLLRSPKGFHGSGLKVNRRAAPRSRVSRLLSVVPEPLTLELTVDIKAGTHEETRRVLEQFKADWPSSNAQWDQLPPTGRLALNDGYGPWKYLDVFRTDRFEDLIGIAPMAVGKAKLMIIASAEDPYPYGDYEPIRVGVRAGAKNSVTLFNDGSVPASPRFYWKGQATTLRFGHGNGFEVKLRGEALIDFSPTELVVTEANVSTPIVTSWNQEPGFVVSGYKQEAFTFTSSAAGTVELHMPPRWEEFY